MEKTLSHEACNIARPEPLKIDAEHIGRFVQVLARILVTRTLRKEIAQKESPGE